MGGIQLRSPAISDHAPIAGRYAHDGGNVSPALEWSGVPDGTVELALICEDPDAPSGTFTHWVLAGIDPGMTGVTENETPPGSCDHVIGPGHRHRRRHTVDVLQPLDHLPDRARLALDEDVCRDHRNDLPPRLAITRRPSSTPRTPPGQCPFSP
jgi:hypothetical protein